MTSTDALEPTVTVTLTRREACAVAHAVELLRDACAEAQVRPGTDALDVAHLRLLSAIERQERPAA